MSQLEGKQRYEQRHGPRGDSAPVQDGRDSMSPSGAPARFFLSQFRTEIRMPAMREHAPPLRNQGSAHRGATNQ
jgi:hypothetical protein